MAPMEMFRSEEMELMQILIPFEYAFDIVYALGEVGMLQFKDLNSDKSAFQRGYSNQVKRYDEMARKLRFFTDQVATAEIEIAPAKELKKTLDSDELEAKLETLELELVELNANGERLQRTYNELLELQVVIEKAGGFFDDARVSASSVATDSDSATTPLLAAETTGRLGFVAGTIQMEKVFAFERLLFRATRGNMFLKYVPVGPVADPATGEKQEKAVFVAFFSGDRARSKMMKICEAFGANRYPLPEEIARQRQMLVEVTGRLREIQTTIETGVRYRESVLNNLAAELKGWSTQVLREKAVYHTLNKRSVDATKKVLVAEAWCPVVAKVQVAEALKTASDKLSSGVSPVFSVIPTRDLPPTYFINTELQGEFQNITDAYGVAAYREANPAVYAIITFPFLFAVMFGDLGHGFMMLLFALWMVMNEKSLGKQDLGDILGMMFGGRYVILLMSIFSMYTGVLYNECFSMAMQVGGPQHWSCPGNATYDNVVAMKFNGDCPEAFSHGLDMKQDGVSYPFGVDPGWKGTSTELMFLNSVKMKMSILMGVVQMDLGVMMSFFNHIYFRDWLSIWCEFIPQMLFLNGMFGYLCLLIVLKWVQGSTADLYHTLIYMFLGPGDVACGGACKENVLYGDADGVLQGRVQVVLLLVMFVSVPWMLIPKPYILKARHEKKQKAEYAALADEEGGHSEEEEHEEFEFGEVMVHQMIHTIEFVLGAVSNTASYLRLWALSLAHSQLSAVFYDRVLMTGMKSGPLGLFIAFGVFFFATMGVLMVMESLSAFLHALRLHWVEFMNKFYHGDGYQFLPFAFKEIDNEDL